MKEAHARITFPASRLGTIDLGRIARDKHHVAALLEIDVTTARKRLRQLAHTGRNVSFVAWLINCIARSLEKHPEVNARRCGRRKKISFSEATISVAVERMIDGVLAPIPVVLRNAGKLSVDDIAETLRQEASPDRDHKFAVNASFSAGTQRVFFALPGFIRRLVMKLLLRNPFRANRAMGTAVFTAAGMTGNAPAWVLPKTFHPLCFALGSIVEKPWAVKGRVEVRQVAHLTVLGDHDVMDGAPLARFIRRLCSSLQKAEGL
jgi:pyruvate/2-oxoglutarate dehydrogenase complex dihydrolipoamide acyltransferase (E2) component